MHGSRARIKNLHAVKTDIALATAGVARDHGRERDEGAAVSGPAGEDGKDIQIGIALDHFLALSLFDHAGGDSGQPRQLRQHPELVPQRARRFHARELLDITGDLLDILNSQRHSHALRRAEGVDENGNLFADDVFEQ